MLTACASTPVVDDSGSSEQLESFDYAWTRIRDTYPYEDMRGIDWAAARTELRPQAEAAKNAAELRPVLRALLGRLGESHFAVLGRTARSHLDRARPSESGDAGLVLRPDRGELLVVRTSEDGAARAAGVRAGWTLRRIDDLDLESSKRSLAAENVPLSDLALVLWMGAESRLRGPVGSVVRLGFVDPSGGHHQVELARRASRAKLVRFGHASMHVEYEERSLPREISYVRFTAFMMPVPVAFTKTARSLVEKGARGLVIDLRGNRGGLAAIAMGMTGHLVSKPMSLGTMVQRRDRLELSVHPRVRSERFSGPVAVLIDGGSASTSEILARGLSLSGRARLFGSTTAGKSLPSSMEKLPNGDILQFAVGDFLDASNRRLEGEGVEPDVRVELDRVALARGRDTVLEAALEWLTAEAERR